jgi:formamidopyrimidine-DNA glycosylase
MLTGQALERLEIINSFVLRSVTPPPLALAGRRVESSSRIGKRVVLGFEGDLFAVIHLMIAGRLRWRAPGKKIGKIALAAFVFAEGTLFLTEAGSTRRASLHLVEGADALEAFDRGGIEPMEIGVAEFATRLRSENHTVKRALTDPRLFSGIGNSYSDEILHRARMSPMLLTSRIDDTQVAMLFAAIRDVLTEWTARLRVDVGDHFPEEVTAFHEGMAVHGRFGLPCPDCGAPVQRIRYASNETNYCARCQNEGRILADRAMSRLLKGDWPRSLDELD